MKLSFLQSNSAVNNFMSTGINCVFLNTCDKLQPATIVDTYLTFARAVCTFNANQYNSQCHRYLINIYQALCIRAKIVDFRHSFTIKRRTISFTNWPYMSESGKLFHKTEEQKSFRLMYKTTTCAASSASDKDTISAFNFAMEKNIFMLIIAIISHTPCNREAKGTNCLLGYQWRIYGWA